MPSNVPTNQKLWNLCVIQAKAKFRAWPSPAASAWVRKTYQERGGTFTDSTDKMTPQQRKDHIEQEHQDAKEAKLHNGGQG